MECPRCAETLSEITVDEVVLDRCANCAGIWFDFASLERVLARDSRALKVLMPRRVLESPHDDETLQCPRCSGTLIRMRTSGEPVVYYGCLTCYGRWLDGREMERIVGHSLALKFEKLFRQILD